ncbi:class I SAM-dependent methyltransferase [Magnetospira sp. QH-2]|uniref:class I SAM-dependent methyltransferase n=1 Tax=Magnetospira sp. (strain QH-2) TaxID=1288970 RepID=UPI0003E81253|nr:class I SAM-dependent methyltransferase [Magnetospira sp. QH-2]CCQ73940.1 Conserved protein of unknown function [Magnetospira sp. QH-2]
MFDQLATIHQRPLPFSVYTADLLWTEPYLAKQMLQYHLNQDTDLASRPLPRIDDLVGWIDETFSLDGKAVCDLGCGPGLYAQRFAARGARVSGVDFSVHSIAHARKAANQAGLAIAYEVDDYLQGSLPGEQDLITLIYCDLCALSPEQRATLYAKIRAVLKPGGHFLFDVSAPAAYQARSEGCEFGFRTMNGFWAEGDYYSFQNTFKYDADMLVLDQFTIIEPQRTWQVFNWIQSFEKKALAAELAEHGFEVVSMHDDLGGTGGKDGAVETYGVVARIKA